MNIDRIARWYRWLEYAAYGRALERCRFAYLDRLCTARNILVMGEGDGRALQRLLASAPTARVEVFEQSAAMIALAKRRNPDATRVHFHQQDARRFHAEPCAYDAIVTCFFFDCFTEHEAQELIRSLSLALVPDGLWLVSDFAMPTTGWRQLHAKLLLAAMYHFFRLTTNLEANALPPTDDLLHQAGLTRIAMQETRAGLLRAEVWKKKAD